MPRVEEVARSALAAVDTDAHVELACLWLNERIQEAAAYGKFRFLRLTRSITWPAVVQTGSVTIAQGDTKVTGDNTAAALWNQNLKGRMFQTKNVWYRIAQVDPGVLQLETPFSEASVSVGSYKIVAHVQPF